MRFFNAFSIALVGALAGGVASAGVNRWTTSGPPGGGVGVIADPRVAGTLYAGSSSGIFKSTDNGATWFSVGLGGQQASPLATSPNGRVYAGGSLLEDPNTLVGTLYASPDGGGQWNQISQAGFTGYGLVVDPFLPTTLYRSANFAPPHTGAFSSELSRSTDAGATWTRIDSGLGLDGALITALVADPNTLGTLYVATNPNQTDPRGFHGVFKSVDVGSTWVLLTSSLGLIPALALDPSNPSVVFAGGPPDLFTSGPGGVFKSVDGGATFVQSSTGLTNTAVTALVVDPAHPNRIYAATGAGVFTSTNGGASWQPMNAGLTDLAVYSLAIESTGTHLHAGTASGVFDFNLGLLLNPGRSFSVALTATDQRSGRTGAGLAIPRSDIFGYFSIPAITGNPGNPEVFVKMLDGTASNGHYWFFYGGLTDLEYTLTVTDGVTGRSKTYSKAAGSECGGSDTATFGP